MVRKWNSPDYDAAALLRFANYHRSVVQREWPPTAGCNLLPAEGCPILIILCQREPTEVWF